MQYINPFELLGLKYQSKELIDDAEIRKATRLLFADIELSGNDSITFKGIELSRSECLSIISDLDDPRKRRLHFLIALDKPLCTFVTSADFSQVQLAANGTTSKEDDVVNFLSPYIASIINKHIVASFKRKDFQSASSILQSTQFLRNADIDVAFKGLSLLLRETVAQLASLRSVIKDGKSSHIATKFHLLRSEVLKIVDSAVLNLLPSYFQPQRDSIGLEITYLASAVHNKPHYNYPIALEIAKLATVLKLEGKARERVASDFKVIENSARNLGNSGKPASNVTASSEIESEDEPLEENAEPSTMPAVEGSKDSKTKTVLYGLLTVAVCVLALFFSPIRYGLLGLISLFSIFRVYDAFKPQKDGPKPPRFSKLLAVTNLSVGASFFYYPAGIYFAFLSIFGTVDEYTRSLSRAKKAKWYTHLIYYALAFVATYFFVGDIFENHESPTTSEGPQELLTADSFYEKGKSLMEKESYSEAIVQFDKAIELDSKFEEAFHMRGVSHAKEKQYTRALSDYREAASNGLLSESFLADYAVAFHEQKTEDSANYYLEKALEIAPKSSWVYHVRGTIKVDNGKYRDAIKDFTSSIEYGGKGFTFFARGSAYIEQKDFQQAIKDITIAIDGNPEVPEYYIQRGRARSLMGQLELACDDWNTAKAKGGNVDYQVLNQCDPFIVEVKNGELADCEKNEQKYNMGIDNSLTITAGRNSLIAIRLIDVKTEMCIRYAIVNSNSTCKLRNIPEAKYYLLIAYGDSWRIRKWEKPCNGKFSKTTLVEKGTEILDFNRVKTADGYQIPSYSIKLELRKEDPEMNTFKTVNISEEEFFKK